MPRTRSPAHGPELFRVVIPARYGSSRLPGKPLRVIAGKPLIQWVYELAGRCGAAEVLIATDDERIVEVARGFGAVALMTARHHASGTDRVAEVAALRGWPERSIVVNLQGDEPLMPSELPAQTAALLGRFPRAAVATLSAPLESAAALRDANVVKVVADLEQRALYFSRAPIPWVRDEAAMQGRAAPAAVRRHLGLYAYRVGALRRLAALPPSPLEALERLEQLRALEHGLEVRVAACAVAPGADVNTLEDIARVEAQLERQAAYCSRRGSAAERSSGTEDHTT